MFTWMQNDEKGVDNFTDTVGKKVFGASGASEDLVSAPNVENTTKDLGVDPDKFERAADDIEAKELANGLDGFEDFRGKAGLGERFGSGGPDVVDKPGLERSGVDQWEGGPGSLFGQDDGPQIGKGGMDSDDPAQDKETKTPETSAEAKVYLQKLMEETAKTQRELQHEAETEAGKLMREFETTNDPKTLEAANKLYEKAAGHGKEAAKHERLAEQDQQDPYGDNSDRPGPEDDGGGRPTPPSVDQPSDLGALPDVRPGVLDNEAKVDGFVLNGVFKPDSDPLLKDYNVKIDAPESVVRDHQRPDIDPVEAHGTGAGPKGLFKDVLFGQDGKGSDGYADTLADAPPIIVQGAIADNDMFF